MKINRRGFLSLGLGASAGLTLSPLPWKLLDDVAIWTQNWPWVPVPKKGVESFHQSTCALCPGGCGITVRRIDERVVSVAGQKDHPLNRGGLCPLGLSAPQLLYTPNRISSPMLKTDGEFRSISWTEAISTLESGLKELQNRNTPDRLACLAGSGNDIVSRLLQRFLQSFGSTKFYSSADSDDAWEQLSEQVTGSRFVPGYDLENADLILSPGCDLAEGWGSPVRTMQACSDWKKNGAELIQVESRLSATAAVADQWIAAMPGTEAKLTAAVGRMLIEKYPETGNRDLRSFFRNGLSAAAAEQETGVNPQSIQMLADRLTKARKPLVLCREGRDGTPASSAEIVTTLALNMLLGNLDRPGGLYRINRQSHISWSGISQFDFASPDSLFRAIADKTEPPVEMLLISGCNPCYSLAATDRIVESFSKIPYVVSFSEYWNETVLAADLILPNHTFLERYQDIPVYSGLTRPLLGLSRPVSRQIFDTKNTGDVILELARRLGGDIEQAFPWKSWEDCLKNTLSLNWKELEQKGWVELEQKPLKNQAGDTALPDIKTGNPSVNEDRYPFTLVTRNSMQLAGSSSGVPPFLLKTVPDTVLYGDTGVVDINPLTAAKLGLAEKDRARLTTPEAEAEVMVHLDEGTMPDTVVLPHGLGRTAFGPFLAGRGVSAVRLLRPEVDPLTKRDTAWTVRAQLQRV